LFVWVGLALALAAASRGAFDPTLEPLMVAWGFHRDGEPSPPSPVELSQALERVGYEAVQRFRVDGVATLNRHGRQLDVSGMLEGYAADRLSGELATFGVAHSLVQVGDEVRVQGRGPHGLWRVGVPGTQTVLSITNRGLASAGHPDEPTSTLNPGTGQLAASDVRHVTVLAPTAAEADGLATAVRVAGSEAGLSLLASRIDVAAWVVKDDGSVLTVGPVEHAR
jgi:thiamine biosynthesis lipoprotein